MRKHKLTRTLALLLTFALLVSVLPGVLSPVRAAQEKPAVAEVSVDRISAELTQTDTLSEAEGSPEVDLDPQETVRIFIVFEGKSLLEAGYSTRNLVSNTRALEYTRALEQEQTQTLRRVQAQALDGEELPVRRSFTVALNAVSATVPYGNLEAISKIDGVKGVYLVPVYDTCTTETKTITAGSMVGSYDTWAAGYTGAGMRIAVIDTGLDTDHPSFSEGGFLYGLEQTAAEQNTTVDSYDLLDVDEIGKALPYLNAAKDLAGVTADQLHLNAKVPFAFNYIDQDLDVTHDHDTKGDHGTHVSGIAAANLYVDQNGGTDYVNMRQTQGVVGIAPDAQLLCMKVFGKNGGAYSDDYIAAIQDCLYLGVDVINMSLGSSAGFTRSYEGTELVNEVFDRLSSTDVVVAVSAGNAYSSAYSNETGTDRLLTGDVDNDVLGSPGAYGNSLTVASAVNSGITTHYFTAAAQSFTFADTATTPFESLAGSDESREYAYLFLGDPMNDEDTAKYGAASAYTAVVRAAVKGKIVLVSRGGGVSFQDKQAAAQSAGAAALIVYNNAAGDISMRLDDACLLPSISISKAAGEAIRDASTKQDDGSLTGMLQVYRDVKTFENVGAGMSDFSSWGVPSDLTLKPEITAPGGNIYSSTDNGTYGLMSGTSMAAPSTAGMAALVLQYIQENKLDEKTGLSARALAQALLMSTAVPLTETDGEEYSPRKQGAGLANVKAATETADYLLVGAQEGNDGKVKVSLRDDPERTGVYTFSFDLYHTGKEAEPYTFRASVLTEDVMDIDGERYMAQSSRALHPKVQFEGGQYVYDLNGDNAVDEKDAQLISDYCAGTHEFTDEELALLDLNQDGKVDTADGYLYLLLLEGGEYEDIDLHACTFAAPAGGKLTVTATITLSADDRAYLEQNFENGVYIEGFVYATPENGCELSLPFLGFYGNWTSPSMFEHAAYYNDAVSYSGGVMSLLGRVGDNSIGLGLNPYATDDAFLPERAAISNTNPNALSSVSKLSYTLIRNAATVEVRLGSGESTYYSQQSHGLNKAYYNANTDAWIGVGRAVSIGWAGLDNERNPLPENTTAELSITALPEYVGTADPAGTRWSMPITIDNTAPALVEGKDGTLDPEKRTLTFTAKDNQYIAAVMLLDSTGSSVLQRIAANQTAANTEQEFVLDLSDLRTTLCYVALADYAMNVRVYRVDLSAMNPALQKGVFYGFNTKQGWNTFTSETADAPTALAGAGMVFVGAEYVDGHIFAASNGGALYVIEPGTFIATKIGELGFVPFDMAFDFTTNTMYAVGLGTKSGTGRLYTVDLVNGTATAVQSFSPTLVTLACDNEGTLYGATYDSYNVRIYSMKPGQTPTTLGRSGYGASAHYQAMAYDHENEKLYWTNYYENSIGTNVQQRLLEIDTQSGKATQIKALTYHNVDFFIPYVCDSATGLFPTLEHTSAVHLEQNTLELYRSYSADLSCYVTPWTAADTSVDWSSSDPSVASVSADGTVSALSVGTAVITAASHSDPDVNATCTVTVKSIGTELSGYVKRSDGSAVWAAFNGADAASYRTIGADGTKGAIVAADRTENGILATTFDYATESGMLLRIDESSMEATEIAGVTVPFTDLTYSGKGQKEIYFCYGYFFGILATSDRVVQGEQVKAGSPLAYNLSSLVGTDFFTGITYVGSSDYGDDYGMGDLIYALTQSGELYQLVVFENGGLLPNHIGNIGVRHESMDTQCMAYTVADGGHDYLMYLLQDARTGSVTVYAIGFDADGNLQAIRTSEFGRDVATVVGCYPTQKAADAGTSALTAAALPDGTPLHYEVCDLPATFE